MCWFIWGQEWLLASMKYWTMTQYNNLCFCLVLLVLVPVLIFLSAVQEDLWQWHEVLDPARHSRFGHCEPHTASVCAVTSIYRVSCKCGSQEKHLRWWFAYGTLMATGGSKWVHRFTVFGSQNIGPNWIRTFISRRLWLSIIITYVAPPIRRL